MVGFDAFFPKRVNTKFVVRNIAPGNKCIHLFMCAINNGDTRDLLAIPTVSEADLRHSLLKGELLIKFLAHEVEVVESNIDLLQFEPEQKAFLESIGIVTGLEVEIPAQPPIGYSLEVAKSGTSYTSIKTAVESILDSSAIKPYVVQVYPGVYDEDPFTIPAYVTVKGMGELFSTVLRTTNNSSHFITGSSGAEMANLSIIGPTGVGFAAVNYEDTGYTPFIARHCEVRVGYYGFWCHPAAFGSMHCFECSNHYVGFNHQIFMLVTGFGFLTGLNCTIVSMVNNSCRFGYYASGANAEMSLDICTFVAPGTTDGVFADQGASVKLSSCAFSEGLNAIHIGSTGINTSIYATGTIIRSDFTWDLLIDTPLSAMAFQGVAERNKVSIPSGTTFSASFLDRGAVDPESPAQ